MKQTQLFFSTEGDAWFARNRDRLGKTDPIDDMLQVPGLNFTSVLEIGCANGWRLAKLREKYKCKVHGVDPSTEAILDGWRNGLKNDLDGGSARSLPYGNGAFDLVIFGFCLYLCEPADLFRIAGEADRVLRHGGHIIIHDFANSGVAHARTYIHHPEVLAYHLNFPSLWLAHPWYRLVTSRLVGDGAEMVTMLAKNANAIAVSS